MMILLLAVRISSRAFQRFTRFSIYTIDRISDWRMSGGEKFALRFSRTVSVKWRSGQGAVYNGDGEPRMITELDISNFRHIERLAVAPLGRITLIGGRNGVGKTALLEALWLFTGANSPGLAMAVDKFRGVSERLDPNFSASVFRNVGARQPIVISTKGTPNGARRSLELEVDTNDLVTVRSDTSGISGLTETSGGFRIVGVYTDENGEKYTSQAWQVIQTFDTPLPVPAPLAAGIREEQARIPDRIGARFMPARHREPTENLSARFGKLQLAGKEKRATELLRHLEPSLTALTVISTGGSSVIHAYIGDNLPIPVNLVGEGFSRMLELAVGIADVSGGLLLVDEIENGLHYSTHQGVFSTLFKVAEEFDTQVVATTHSRECAIAARKALGDKGDGAFAYHRIDRRDGKLSVAHFDAEMMDAATDFGMEIR